MNLQENQHIIFLWNGYYGTEEESEMDGHIIQVGPKFVCVCCLSGLKSHNEDVPLDKVLGIYDKDSPQVKFKHYHSAGTILTESGKKYIEMLGENND